MTLASQFLGRLHPLLVHLPIGILLLAGTFEFLSYFSRYRKLRMAVQPTLFFGALFALASVISGLFLSQEGGYDDRLVYLHRNTGIATTVFAWILVIIRKSAITFFRSKESRKIIRVLLFVPLIGLLMLTGHLGGSLTHGEDYLFSFNNEDDNGTPVLKLTSTGNLDSVVFYSDILEPILNSRCYSCHSSTKQKGQLRLDLPSFISKGGKHGSILDGIIADSSTLYSRLMLPVEDEHHMPPEDKPQLSSSELALIHAWIEEGAPFEKQIGRMKGSPRIKSFILALLDRSSTVSIIPSREVNPASLQNIEALKAKGILVIPLSSATNYLSVSFVNARSSTDNDLKLLLPIKDQLLLLDLGMTRITNGGLDVVGQLSNITQLNLEYDSIQDSGLEKLKPLTNLTSLNLVGTDVSDTGLQYLSTIKSLKKVFLYQTNVTSTGIREFLHSAPHILADTGSYSLPALVTDTMIYKFK